jgi:RimJ/RimL family protein N-acetyltransferase
MFKETPILKLAKHCSCFPGYQLKMVLASLVEENTDGQLWTAPQSQGRCLQLLWDQGNNVFYFAGEPITTEVTTELAALLRGEIRNRAAEAGLSWFKVCLLPRWDEKVLDDLFPEINLKQVNKLLFGFEALQPYPVKPPEVEGIEFALIDRAFLERNDLENLNSVREEIDWMWSGSGRNRSQEFGVAAVADNRVICWCTAEYVSQNMCGIGIETLPEYEKRGVATATTVRFVERCLKRKLKPFWECDRENIGSVRVAEKVGFRLLEERIFHAGKFS